ncbi:hypothetical protein QA811_29235, partial [Streptomyces sp. B21-102]
TNRTPYGQSFAIHREPVGKRITTAIVLADDPGGTLPAVSCDRVRSRTGDHTPAAGPSASTTMPFPSGVSTTVCPRWTSRPATAACTATRIPSRDAPR